MKREVADYLGSISRDIKLDEGVNGIKKVLVALHRAGKASIRDLAGKTHIAPPVISLLSTKLAESGLIHRDASGIRFTERGMKYVEVEMQIVSLELNACPCCAGTSFEIDVDGIHQQIFARLEDITKHRPEADVSLDQVKCTPETILRRLFILHDEGAFDGTRLLFLGDDDFMSISTCIKEFLSDYFIQHERDISAPFMVEALDIDPRIVEGIN
nr:bis-aminopropyl spermidine synthase family protein [Candidatus Sigynarchaeota archaeon]